MRAPGVWLRVLAVCAALALAGGLAGARAQTGPAPPGAVGMGNGPAKADPDPVVAEVEGQSIHLSEVGDAIRALPAGGGNNPFAQLFPAMRQRLIEQVALAARARREGLDKDPAIQRAMQAAVDRVLENAALRHDGAADITEQAVRRRYDETVAGKPGPTEVHGRVIVLPTEQEAQEAIGKLANGADFATLAKQVSKDASRGSGGDLGFIRRGGVDAEAAAVLFALSPGEVTAYPVRTAAGWCVLKVEARRNAPAPTFAEASAGLREELLRQDVQQVVRETMRGVVVRVYDLNGQEVIGGARTEPDQTTPAAGR
jgi:peptidyl-prolyl cis-trans isomerase C